MKLFVFCLLLLSFNAHSELYIVDSPDMPIAGEYWDPTEPGWGLTMSIQPANFVSSGYYLQGTAYTYDDDGNPMWYLFQNEFTPNSDPYAWRENRGPLAVFESQIGISHGGPCFGCTHSPNTVSLADKENITLEWSDPVTLKMTVDGKTKHLKQMFYHDGLSSNNADFITKRMFFVHGAFSNNLNKPLFTVIKGTSVFYPLAQDVLDSIEFWDSSRFEIDTSLEWYVTKNNVLAASFATEETLNNEPYFINIFKESSVSNDTNFTFLLFGYDKVTGKAFIYPGMSVIDIETGDVGYSLRTCANQTNTAISFSGYLNPALSLSSRFYYNDDDYMSKCSNTGADTEWKRQHFIDLTGLPVGFDDLKDVPFMLNSPSY